MKDVFDRDSNAYLQKRIFCRGLMKLKVIIEKSEDGYFVTHCPALKSCWTQGKTEDEALSNIKEAIELHLECDEDIVESETVTDIG